MTNPIPTLSADGPVLLFGGPYSNLEATAAVLDEARRLAIPADRIICTGDVVAYCGSARETTELVRASGIHVVKGNCDEQLALDADDCGCGFPDGSACDRLAAAWYAHARTQVSDVDRVWFGQLPERINLEISGARLAVVHGSVSQMNAFVFAGSPSGEKRRELALADVDGVVGGHSGLPFSEIIDGKLWHNAGVVGMPANDGMPRVWFSILTPIDGNGLSITHRSLVYDCAGAMSAMERAGLPPDYRIALSSGVWPSHDVLPDTERGMTGVSLEDGTVEWSAAVRRSRRSGLLWPLIPGAAASPSEPLRSGQLHLASPAAI